MGFRTGLQGQARRDGGELGVGLGLECWLCLLGLLLLRWLLLLLDHKLGLQVL